MSEEHPPIPKSPHFFKYPNPIDAQSEWPWVFAYAEQYVAKAGPETKQIMCAVAEVEWLKRMDRWQALWSRVADRYLMRRNGTSGSHRKTLQYQLDRTKVCAEICEENAKAWREWGAR